MLCGVKIRKMSLTVHAGNAYARHRAALLLARIPDLYVSQGDMLTDALGAAAHVFAPLLGRDAFRALAHYHVHEV